jgi:hypothetical protein
MVVKWWLVVAISNGIIENNWIVSNSKIYRMNGFLLESIKLEILFHNNEFQAQTVRK